MLLERIFNNAMADEDARCLKKGGWVEVVEMDIKATSDDGSLPPDNHLTQYLNLLIEAAAKSNRKLDIATDLHGLVTAAGFTDLEETAYKLPMGTWPKSRELKAIGLFHREQFLEGIQGIAMGFFTRSLGWSVQEVEVLLAKVRNDVKNPQYHTYWRT